MTPDALADHFCIGLTLQVCLHDQGHVVAIVDAVDLARILRSLEGRIQDRHTRGLVHIHDQDLDPLAPHILEVHIQGLAHGLGVLVQDQGMSCWMFGMFYHKKPWFFSEY